VDKFVARQPIFDRSQHVYGYEILFRSGFESYFRSEDVNQATYSAMADSFLLLGIETLTGGRRAFFNCTRDILVKGYAEVLPTQRTGFELLEDIEPDDEVITVCRRLNAMGYVLALDDFVYSEKFTRLLDLIHIVKVDCRNTSKEDRKELVQRFSKQGIALLAEKVETQEEYQEARELGFRYFQGYFFGKPQVLSGRDVPMYRRNYLQILHAISQPDPDIQHLEQIIKHETSLCYKLLRYLNSPYFGFRGEIKSIRHSLSLLGINELKKWISLVTMAGLATEKPQELVVSSIIRANFCESLSGSVGMRERDTDLFLMGLLSMMDAILDRPMSEVLTDLAISPDVRTALLNGRNRFRDVFDLVVDYEVGDWQAFKAMASSLHVHEPEIPEMYIRSVANAWRYFQA
jgi:EAL and modified HD-GYP domain-containing signal transduction protein